MLGTTSGAYLGPPRGVRTTDSTAETACALHLANPIGFRIPTTRDPQALSQESAVSTAGVAPNKQTKS